MMREAEEFDRVIPLDGGHNFRDIGGYPTSDGRHVAKGLVFRSGTMCELTERDHSSLEALGLRLICDLRSNTERSKRPSRLPEAPPYEIWSRDHELSVGDLTAVIRAPGAMPTTVRSKAIQAYRTLAYEQAPSYRELFLRVAYGPLPLVFHCAAGKDRTGIAAALLLELLQVERVQVIADYALTDRFFSRGWELIAKDPFGHGFAEIDLAVWEPVVRADPAYLEAMFQVLEERHGSTLGFVRDELGLSDADIVATRDRLLV